MSKSKDATLRKLIESLPWEKVAERMLKKNVRVNDCKVTIAIEWDGVKQRVSLMIYPGSLKSMQAGKGYQNDIDEIDRSDGVLDSFWIDSIWYGSIGLVLAKDKKNAGQLKMYIGLAEGKSKQADEVYISERGPRLPDEWIKTIFGLNKSN